MKVIILAGGSGTRLWPLSRNSFPKQFLNFGQKHSLLQKTILRFLCSYASKDLLIVTNEQYYHLVKNQAQEIDDSLQGQILIEPKGKNTAPAIALAVKFLLERNHCDEKETFLVSSSDHLISPEHLFLEKVRLAETIASNGNHVIFGVRPQKPETGYGYIQCFPSQETTIYNVARFVEKPDYETAKAYLFSGDYLWNAGIFLFQIATYLQEMKKYCPSIQKHFDGSFQEMFEDFDLMPEISIDYALMEKSKKIKVVPLDLSWSDVGSWDSVYETLEKDSEQNVKIGNVFAIETKNSFIFSQKKLVSTIGVEDLLIVDTEDALLVSKKGESQRVKPLVDLLKKEQLKEATEHVTSYRPWGKYSILEEGERYKIKHITVNPFQKLSLQMHHHRSEHWVVVKGKARATLNEEICVLEENESIYVPKMTQHRLENPASTPLELIEVQVGDYVGEDDIVRFEDVYGRIKSAATLNYR